MSVQKHEIEKLLNIMEALRNKETGCPWDIEQDFASIAPYTIEEAYEVAEAIENNDIDNLREELGDLLLQVVFHAQMAKEEGLFTFEDVAEGISAKLVYRHPHVFGDLKSSNAEEVEKIWNAQKEEEKKAKAISLNVLDDIPRHFPALMRAQKIQKKVIAKGFNWPDIDGVFLKLEEEIQELKTAIQNQDQQNTEEELGDILFVCGILGRWLKVDAENALQQSNNKFIRRFNAVEQILRDKDINIDDATLEQMDAAWDETKRKEKENQTA
jgi:MazG family protein